MRGSFDNIDLPIALTGQEWNAVLDQLSNGPWRIVQPLIARIAEQIERHRAPGPRVPAMPGQAPSLSPAINGIVSIDPEQQQASNRDAGSG